MNDTPNGRKSPEDQSERTPVVANLDESQLEELVESIRTAADGYAKMDAMEPYVSWGERRRLLWELTRSEALDTWNQPALWDELANGLAWASGEDVVAFLGRIESYEFEHRETERLVEFWPLSLDELAMRAYEENPEPFDEHWRDFPEFVRRGFELVLRRFGTLEREELSYDAIDALARQHAVNGLPTRVLLFRDGTLEEVELHNHAGVKPGLYEFIELFGTREEWSRRLLEHSLETNYGPPFARSYDAWRVADVDELEELFSKADIQPHVRPRVHRLLVEERDDEPEELIEVARALSGGGYSGMEAELCAVAALLKWKRRGEPVPEDVEQLLSFKSVGRPAQLQDYYGLDRLVEASKYLPEERLVQRMRELFSGKFSRLAPYAVLRAVSDNEEVVETALQAAEEASTAPGADFTSMHPVAYGLALAGSDVLQEVESAYGEADNPLLRDTYHRAIVHLLAQRAKAGHGVPESYDPFISFVDWESPETDDHNFGHFILEDLLALIANMPEERAHEIIASELEAESPQWPRVLEALQHHPTEPLLQKAFARLDREGVPSGGGSFNWVVRFLESLPEGRHSELGEALATTDAPELHNSVQRVFGEERYDALLDEHGGESSADTSPAEEIERLASEIFAERPDVERTTIYLLERAGEPADPGELNRVGAPPPNLPREEWPHRDGDDASPMEHMVTIDLESMPTLAERVRPDVRAVSVFVFNPEYNEAWSPFSSDAEVLQWTSDQLERGDDPTEERSEREGNAGDEDEAERLEITAVDVPNGVFDNPYALEPEERDPTVEQLRDSVYQAPARAGGAPIWLQEDQAPSPHFLFQFDEEFIPMNLGDMGVMYVFAETAFWQCH